MSTHSMYFLGEIRKISCGYPLLSGAVSMLSFLFQAVRVTRPVNQWILSRLSHMVQSCDQHFQSYDLHFVTQSLYNFWFQDFCDIYLVSICPFYSFIYPKYSDCSI